MQQARIFESLLSATVDFVYLFDLQGRFVFVNKALLDLWGYSLAQAVGKNFFELPYPEELAATLQRQIQQVIDTKHLVRDETRYESPAGLVGYYEYIFSPIFKESGEVEFVAGTTRDISRRKQTEQTLLATQKQLDVALRAGAIATWTLEIEGDRVVGDENLARVFNVSRELIAGAPLSLYLAAVHPEDREGVQRSIGEAVRDRDSYEAEYRVQSVDGERWVVARGLIERGADGRALRMPGVVLDITERKLAELASKRAEHSLRESEARLRQISDTAERLLESERHARSEAERTSRIKDEFLATLSHELRTPLNAILGWSQLMKRRINDAAEVLRGLEVVERNARTQTQIIEDLLDMSGIISGKVRLQLSPLDLTAVLHAAVESIKPTAEAKGVRLALELPLDAAALVRGDAHRLQQVLWNLLSNAVKFTARGGRIDVRLEKADNVVDVVVRDSGEGIAQEFLPYVFDRFRQADASTTRRHGGLGLGLSIVKQLVELHGGVVRVESDGRGAGTTFTVCLPRALGEGQERQQESVHAQLASEPALELALEQELTELSGLRVLVIDDEADARLLVQRLLEDCGAQVTLAVSVEEVLRLVQTSSFDALVSDVGMPGEDGYSLIQRVRSLPAERGGTLPAVALTAYARSEDRARALSAGFSAHLTKPLQPGELAYQLGRLTGRVRESIVPRPHTAG